MWQFRGLEECPQQTIPTTDEATKREPSIANPFKRETAIFSMQRANKQTDANVRLPMLIVTSNRRRRPSINIARVCKYYDYDYEYKTDACVYAQLNHSIAEPMKCVPTSVRRGCAHVCNFHLASRQSTENDKVEADIVLL